MNNRSFVVLLICVLLLGGVYLGLLLDGGTGAGSDPGADGGLSAVGSSPMSLAQPERPSGTESLGRVGKVGAVLVPRRLPRNVEQAAQRNGEVLLIFADAASYEDFLNNKLPFGTGILGELSSLRTVRVSWSGRGALADLMAANPEAQVASNERVYAPEIPKNSTEPGAVNPKGFGISALEYIGVDQDNSQWGEGVTVAVLDTGIVPHRLLDQSKIKLIDLLGDDAPVDGAYAGHGTAVAAIIASSDPLVRGVAPAASLLGIRVLDGEGVGDTFTLAKGIVEAVDQGADIINLSLGGAADSAVLRDAVAYADAAGVIMVAAVGNEGTEGVLYPANYASVIAVTAVDANGERPSFTNTGAAVDVAAPGAGVYTAWVDGRVVTFTGTSAAAPFVAGSLAAAQSEMDGLSTETLRTVASRTSNDAGGAGDDPSYGEGILDVGRILDSQTAGIYDAGVVSHLIPQDNLDDVAEREVPLTVVVENRGTEVDSLRLITDIAGQRFEYAFRDVEPGASVSAEMVVDGDLLRKAGEFELKTEVFSGQEDTAPEDNQKTSLLRFSEPDEDE